MAWDWRSPPTPTPPADSPQATNNPQPVIAAPTYQPTPTTTGP
jgi:hypothetical protein